MQVELSELRLGSRVVLVVDDGEARRTEQVTVRSVRMSVVDLDGPPVVLLVIQERDGTTYEARGSEVVNNGSCSVHLTIGGSTFPVCAVVDGPALPDEA